VRIWLDPKTVDALSRLRWPGGDLSDVILRLAQLEVRPLPKSEGPVAPRTEPEQIEERERILSEGGQTPSDGPAIRGDTESATLL
jgi:hypothetical protein